MATISTINGRECLYSTIDGKGMVYHIPIDPQRNPEKLVGAIGKGSASPFPLPNQIWDTFSTKGIKTVFISIGNSASALPDLEIAESLGCPINIVPLGETQLKQWQEIQTILKERKRGDATSAWSFSEGAEKKWILPKNVRIHDALPWWCGGAVETADGAVKTAPVTDAVIKICSDMKLKEAQTRLDILKIDTTGAQPGLEAAVLAAVLNGGFRPSFILVRWSKMPDVDLPTTSAAGHLQNSGYRLIGKNEDRFLYYFTDNDLYQYCSWESDKESNPLFNEIVRTTKTQMNEGFTAYLSSIATAAAPAPAALTTSSSISEGATA